MKAKNDEEAEINIPTRSRPATINRDMTVVMSLIGLTP
jgi:hypothetical protein